jgi:hypothetical protein
MSNQLKSPKVIIILIAVLAAAIGSSAYLLTANTPAPNIQGELNAPINSPLPINNQTINVSNSTIYADNSTIIISPTPEVTPGTTIPNAPSPTPIYASGTWHEVSRSDTQLVLQISFSTTVWDPYATLVDKLYVEQNGVQYFGTVTPVGIYTFNITSGTYIVGTTVPCSITQTP